MSFFRLRRAIQRARYRFMPKIAEWTVRNSTAVARRMMKVDRPLLVLLDNTVLAHGLTHRTAWVSTGRKKWGNHQVDTGYAARMPIQPGEPRFYASVKYLPGIVHLAKTGYISFYTSAELKAERFHQPMRRFRESGLFDYSLFSGIDIKSADGNAFPAIGPSWFNLPCSREQQFSRLTDSNDLRFHALVQELGPKNSLDAWHIRTAERIGAFCFLTMDFSLMRTLRAQHGAKTVRTLTTRVLTPEQLGKELKLLPVEPHILSYCDANGPVNNRHYMPGRTRQPET